MIFKKLFLKKHLISYIINVENSCAVLIQKNTIKKITLSTVNRAHSYPKIKHPEAKVVQS